MVTKTAFLVPLCLLCVLASGCSGGQGMEPAFSAVTVMLVGSPERGGGRTVVLKDHADIREAMSFFPGLSEHRKSQTAGSWYPFVSFTFAPESGEKITVVSDYRYWNKGTGGDFEVKGDLEAYVKKIFAEKKPQAPAQE